MPSTEDLDKMALMLTGATFNQQPGPHEKARIMELCIQSDISHNLGCICDELEGIGARLPTISKALEEIDSSLVPIMEWFDKSKLWEGEAWVRS